MSDRPRRNQERIDYHQLNSTGRIVTRDINRTEASNHNNLNTSFDIDQFSLREMQPDSSIEASILIQDIEDLIDENPITTDQVVNNEATISKLSEHRTSLRRFELLLKQENEDNHDLITRISCTLSNIKEYIKSFKDCKQKADLVLTRQSQHDACRKERSTIFVISDLKRMIAELIKHFSTNISALTDAELLEMKKDTLTRCDLVNKAAEKYEYVLQSPLTKAEILMEVKDIGEQYEQLISLKTKFIKELDSFVHNRDLYKQNLFSASKINIRLDKFSGSGDSVDFYTFKSNFNKLHERSTPRRLLPDLLKNNYLKDPAYSLVKSIDKIDIIWERLQFAYGDVKQMLSRKISQLSSLENISRSKSPESLALAISKIINIIKELMTLAEEHRVENYLYYGEGLRHISPLLTDSLLSRWLTQNRQDTPPKISWKNLLELLEKEQLLQQQKAFLLGPTPSTSSSSKSSQPNDQSKGTKDWKLRTYNSNSSPTCNICDSPDGTSDHVSTSGPNGSRIIQYYTCKKFAELTPANRLSLLKEKGYCYQCLYPGADASSGKHSEGRCQHDFICQHDSHGKYSVRKHVLVCEEHKDSQANKDVLEKFKHRCVRSSNLPTFARNISVSFVSRCFKSATSTPSSDDMAPNHGIFLLQTTIIDNRQYTIFFDNGCSDFIAKHTAIKSLGLRATQESTQSMQISGVGNATTQSTHGTYNVKIPLFNGRQASMSGTCLESITGVFPQYPMDEPFKDLQASFRASGRYPEMLPVPSASVGGEVDFMIGVKYLRFHPKLVYQLHSGLAIYESPFVNPDGGRGVIGGPHHVFTQIHQNFFNETELKSFFSNQFKLFRMGVNINPDLAFPTLPPKALKEFQDAETVGSEITYRCINCRSCKDCKNSTHQQAISIKEEMEQEIINNTINIDLKNQVITATLPFIDNPERRLAPNKSIAMKTYQQQLKKLDRNVDDKAEIIESEAKLQKLGFVDYVHNLTQEQQSTLTRNIIQNFIPWRVVWKTTSLSTPCRIVFDASFPTNSGYSLNDLLAKGTNNLNKLQEILIRWSTHKIGVHTDIRKMYNTIRLAEKDWCYQRYIWQDELDATKIPQEKVIKTLIYGIRSSGNQAEHGLREMANVFKEKYPEVQRIIHEDVYVDDCVTGEETTEVAHTRAEELESVIHPGGFRLKGITFSGEKPLPELTDDGESILVGGIKWFPLPDEVSLNISHLNFSKKTRGKKSLDAINIVPERLTRRHCASKVAEIYDLTGKIAPIVASMKLDLRELCLRQLNWDDVLPDELRQTWLSHFEMMQQIGSIRYKRAIVPHDAINMDIQTLDFGDASPSLICVCIYARFHLKNNTYSCQLVFARTRMVPTDLSLPRAELYASLLNTHTSQIVKRSFKNLVKSSFKFTDSQIALHWIDNDTKPLKPWVRNRVLEIHRFSSKDQWQYIQSKNMVADIGTRRGATLKDVDQSSTWINGFNWMHLPSSQFPVQSAEELKLTESQLSEVEKERSIKTYYATSHMSKTLLEEMKKRYELSMYLVDPLRHNFTAIIRIMAYVIRFCRVFISRYRSDTPKPAKMDKLKINSFNLTNEDITHAEKYFFKKGTKEVIHFIPKSKYEKISIQKDDMLMYTGRILPSRSISIVGTFTDVMKDLSATTFCVPVLDRFSPIAYSISMDVHWNDATVKHSGIETTQRFVLKKAHIIEGRKLIKHIKQTCLRCRYLEKRTVEMAMGPVSPYSLTIAPAFYHTQLDLSGPYQSFSPHHKRTTVKMWLIVFCCCATSAVKIKVMDDYTTTSFIQSFTRFACDHGYPKRLLCDEGSQLVKGCKEMLLDFSDIKAKLMKKCRVEFDVCPVQGHNMHGKVERKIREVNSSIEKSLHRHRLSILQWETLASSIANQINNLPLAIGDITGDFECLDLITPNRLLLGRNNERCPHGMIYCDNPTKIIKENEKIFHLWFEVWLLVHVPKLMAQSKWFASDSVNIGDIVLFTKQESVLSNTYTYGIIKDLEFGDDLLPRKAIIQYKNDGESVKRETYRSIRGLVIIHSVNECDILNELGVMAKNIDLKSSCS